MTVSNNEAAFYRFIVQGAVGFILMLAIGAGPVALADFAAKLLERSYMPAAVISVANIWCVGVVSLFILFKVRIAARFLCMLSGSPRAAVKLTPFVHECAEAVRLLFDPVVSFRLAKK